MPKDAIKPRLAEWQELITRSLRDNEQLRRAIPTLNSCDIFGHAEELLLSERAADGAFKYFGLDQKLASHRAILTLALIDVLFHKRKKGRPKGSRAWNQARLFMLGLHYEELANSKPRISDAKAANEIKRRFSHYRHISSEAIRARLPAAKSALADARRHVENLNRPPQVLPIPQVLPVEIDFASGEVLSLFGGLAVK
jgi:hypothetical protein